MRIAAPPVLSCALKHDHLLDENNKQQAALKEVFRKGENSLTTESLLYQALPQRDQKFRSPLKKSYLKMCISKQEGKFSIRILQCQMAVSKDLFFKAQNGNWVIFTNSRYTHCSEGRSCIKQHYLFKELRFKSVKNDSW